MSKYQLPPDNQQELLNKAQELINSYQNPYSTPNPSTQKSVNIKTALNIGFAAILLLIIGAGIGFIQNRQSSPQTQSVIAQKPQPAPATTPTKQQIKQDTLALVKGASDSATTQDQNEKMERYMYEPYGFSFNYQSDIYEVLETFKERKEEILDEDASIRFEREKQTPPPDLLFKVEVATLSKLLSKSEDEADISLAEIPFRIYVYNNPKDISIKDWFKQYLYYPYEWSKDTEKLIPKLELERGDSTGLYYQDEDTKQVKYIYFNHNQKMYLIWMGDLELASKRKQIGQMLASFQFSQGEEQVLKNNKYNFSMRIPDGDETITQSGNRIEVKDKEGEIIRVFTIFDANTKDSSNMSNWWANNIYSEIGGYTIPNDYDTEQNDTHPLLLNRNGFQVPTLEVTPKATTSSVPIYETSYYLYYDFGKPFIINYTEETSEDAIPQSASWPIITISPLE